MEVWGKHANFSGGLYSPSSPDAANVPLLCVETDPSKKGRQEAALFEAGQ